MTSDTPHPAPEPTPELTDDQLEFLNSLFDLARAGDGEQLLPAIDQGVPVNLSNHKGDTLLILATYNNHPELVTALIERGAEVNRLNGRGQSALSCAVFVQSEESVRALLAAGADPDEGPVSARAAVEMFGLDSMRALLEAHAGSGDPTDPTDPVA
ncbi:ankyrin repeat domain-containing protein [Citricoccus nitrophenolicus]|uniref:Ankyrin repeat domain-containing protein n=1 Tax=Citricoccus nitrophenolicus TaxID=863575 RepID=A0ABV0IN65_9MICC